MPVYQTDSEYESDDNSDSESESESEEQQVTYWVYEGETYLKDLIDEPSITNICNLYNPDTYQPVGFVDLEKVILFWEHEGVSYLKDISTFPNVLYNINDYINERPIGYFDGEQIKLN